MNSVHIKRLTIQREGADPLEARQLARRVAELLGEALADGSAVRPRRDAIVDVHMPPGLAGDRLAEYVGREIRRHLG